MSPYKMLMGARLGSNESTSLGGIRGGAVLNGERSSDEVTEDSTARDAELIDAARREVEGAGKPGGSNGVTLSIPGPAFAVMPGWAILWR